MIRITNVLVNGVNHRLKGESIIGGVLKMVPWRIFFLAYFPPMNDESKVLSGYLGEGRGIQVADNMLMI